MRRVQRITLFLCLAWLAVSAPAYASDVKNALSKRVLVISFFDAGVPWANRVVESLRRNLESESPYPIDLHIEFADFAYYNGEAYRQKLIELYRYKYSHPPLDLVIGMGDEEANFLISYAEDLFGKIPMLIVSANPKKLQWDSLKPNMTSLVWDADIQGNIQVKYLRQSRRLVKPWTAQSGCKPLATLQGGDYSNIFS